MTGKLSERAMLASIHISSWSGMMVDREVTDATNEDFKAEKDAGRYNKRLVAPKFLAGISTAHATARKIHRVYTLPWEDSGARALAAKSFDIYASKMRDCRLNTEKEVKEFLVPENFYMAKDDAKRRLGDMYNEDDYPALDALKHKFDFDVEIKPMPEASDFRAKLSDESMKSIIKDIERRSNERLEKAMNEVFNRVAENVSHMIEKLRAYQPAKDEQKATNLIRDSVVQNIYQLATEVLPVMNITDDPRIDALGKQLMEELVEHSPEILRADAKARALTINKADKILKKVKAYMT